MKSDSELEQIVDTIRTGYQLRYQLRSETMSAHVKLLRSIQIDALRHAREIVADEARRDAVSGYCLPPLDKLIRELELR